MWIAVLIVIDPVSDHPLRSQIVPDELLNQTDILRPCQFLRQSNNQLTGKLCIHPRLKCIDSIPQRLTCLSDGLAFDCRPQPRWNIFRQRQFFMDQIIVAAAIVKQGSGLFVSHPGAMTIRGSRDDVASRSPADHLRPHEHDCHNILLSI